MTWSLRATGVTPDSSLAMSWFSHCVRMAISRPRKRT
jgi:hypothetical protein